MALADFLDHKCDIYHLIQSKDSPGYGLPDSPVLIIIISRMKKKYPVISESNRLTPKPSRNSRRTF